MKQIYLSKTLLTDRKLTPATKLVAHHLFHISGWDNENIIQSQKEIARKLGIEPKTVRTAIASLVKLGYLQINNNTFNFFLNGITLKKSDLSNKELCNQVGDFIVVPMFSLYCDKMTPAERDAYFKFFDFYFQINKHGFSIKKSEIHLNSVSTYYRDDKRSFSKHIQNIKEKGLIDYKSVHVGKDYMKLVGVKVFYAEKKWVIYNGQKQEFSEEKIIETFEEDEATIEPTTEQLTQIDVAYSELSEYQKKEFDSKYRKSSIENQIWYFTKRGIEVG